MNTQVRENLTSKNASTESGVIKSFSNVQNKKLKKKYFIRKTISYEKIFVNLEIKKFRRTSNYYCPQFQKKKKKKQYLKR